MLPAAALIVCLAPGCTTANLRDGCGLSKASEEIRCAYAVDGRLLQKTVWRDGKLVSAWQYEQRWELPLDVIVAVHRGERDYPPSRWIQSVVNGTGRIHQFWEGEIAGFEDYLKGEYWRGAH